MVDMMNGEKEIKIEPILDFRFLDTHNTQEYLVDFEHIIGQQFTKRALEIAAAG